jgi:predicted ATPase
VIATVAFRNFKALRSTSLVLAPFNLVIGPNGSGKTSLIQALLRLRTLAKLPVVSGPAPASRPHGPEIGFLFSPPHDAIEVRLGCVSELVCDLLHVVPANAPGWPALKADIGRIRSYLLDHYAIAEPAARATGAELASNGGNLAAVLAQRRERAPESFAALTAEFLRLLPEFTGLDLIEDADGRMRIEVRLGGDEAPVGADNLSQGTLYTLAVLTLAFDPAPPSILCIEEVDRGIHPRMLREIRDALYRLSYPAAFQLPRAPVQVIATTHSPYLLDLFREHPEEVVIAQKHGRVARFERLIDRADVAELLREGSLGDMWFSGILGGVPEGR